MSVDVAEVGDGVTCECVDANVAGDDVSVGFDVEDGVEVGEVGGDDVAVDLFAEGEEGYDDC